MFDPRRVAAAQGLAVEVVDLGDWRPVRLISEYDPRTKAIRINERVVHEYCAGSASPARAARELIDLAIEHELYHHREATGDVPKLPTRAQREAAADAEARRSVPVGPRLAAFLADPATA